jgi:hypothetical protein
MRVKDIVYSMLTENTGVHFLDSGGTDGRMWQRNAKKSIDDFEKEDEESYSFDRKTGGIYRTVSVYHYLCGLDLDSICEEFNKLNTNPNNWDADDDKIYGVSSEAWNYLTKNYSVEVKYVTNTYNYDSDLSQILQYSSIEIDGDSYFIVQIHNGADVRGGYTDAKLFKSDEYCGGIHEYLYEHKDSYEIEQDILDGYITEFYDYWTNEKVPCEEVMEKLKEEA